MCPKAHRNLTVHRRDWEGSHTWHGETCCYSVDGYLLQLTCYHPNKPRWERHSQQHHCSLCKTDSINGKKETKEELQKLKAVGFEPSPSGSRLTQEQAVEMTTVQNSCEIAVRLLSTELLPPILA